MISTIKPDGFRLFYIKDKDISLFFYKIQNDVDNWKIFLIE